MIKFQDIFANKDCNFSKFSEKSLFYSVQRMTSIYNFCNAGLPILQNHLCQIGNCILPEYEKLKFGHFNPTNIKQLMLIEVSESYVLTM